MNAPRKKKDGEPKRKMPEQEDPPHPIRIPLAIGVVIFALFMATAPFWATDEEGAYRTLVILGYKPLKIGGYDPFGCGLDVFATKFTAISPAGLKVSGNVCKTPYVSLSSVEIKTGDD